MTKEGKCPFPKSFPIAYTLYLNDNSVNTENPFSKERINKNVRNLSGSL